MNEQDFWSRVDRVEEGCWLYRGQSVKYLSFQGQPAHRYAWEQAHGPIAPGMMILHHCDTPGCVRTEPDTRWPDGHLFIGTAADNGRDISLKGRRPGGEGWDPAIKLKGLNEDAIPSSVFRIVYNSLTKPALVTAAGRPIALYIPIGGSVSQDTLARIKAELDGDPIHKVTK